MYMNLCIYCQKNEIVPSTSNPKYCPTCITNRVWNHVRIFKKICKFCKNGFDGKTGNAEFCSDLCKFGGTKICLHCAKSYNPRDYNTKYCSRCGNDKLFLVGTHQSAERIQKQSRSLREWARTPKGIARYRNLGKSNSKSLKKYFLTTDGKNQIKRVAKIQSAIMKARIKSGEWTPNIHNRWTHWDARVIIDNTTKKFRSSWEACFWFCNQTFEYEKIRVPCGNRVVITDFVDEKNKTIYEIKPRAMYRKEKNKINAIIRWCQRNGYLFVWLNEYNIMKYIDKRKFICNVNNPQLIKMLNAVNEKIKNNID